MANAFERAAAIDGERDNIDPPKVISELSMLSNVLLTQRDQARGLALVHGFLRGTTRTPRPGLDLHKDQFIAVERNQVDLALPRAPFAPDDAPTKLGQPSLGESLSGIAQGDSIARHAIDSAFAWVGFKSSRTGRNERRW